MVVLGIDTSNYTTSAAIFDGETGVNIGRLLEVRPGELGLRQSDALFQHVQRLPGLLKDKSIRVKAYFRIDNAVGAGGFEFVPHSPGIQITVFFKNVQRGGDILILYLQHPIVGGFRLLQERNADGGGIFTANINSQDRKSVV